MECGLLSVIVRGLWFGNGRMILYVMVWYWVWGFRGWDVVRMLNCLVNVIGGCVL